MNKEGVSELIKKLFVSEVVKKYDDGTTMVKCSPILIGDILEKMDVVDDETAELVDKWGNCGFTKSLQEIVEKSGWEKYCENCDECFVAVFCNGYIRNDKPVHNYTQRLKDPNDRSLIEFLLTIFK